MAHTYTSSLFHVVFATKGRRPFMTRDLRARLWPYLGGIARDNGMAPLAVGGTEDHVHLLLGLPATLHIAKAVQLVKGGSSKWVHDSFSEHAGFSWQAGYGAFTIGISQVETTRRYIENQEAHHRKTSFMDEFRAILRRHNIEWDEKRIWS